MLYIAVVDAAGGLVVRIVDRHFNEYQKVVTGRKFPILRAVSVPTEGLRVYSYQRDGAVTDNLPSSSQSVPSKPDKLFRSFSWIVVDCIPIAIHPGLEQLKRAQLMCDNGTLAHGGIQFHELEALGRTHWREIGVTLLRRPNWPTSISELQFYDTYALSVNLLE